MDTIEQAQEGIEKAHHVHEEAERGSAAKWIAVAIAAMAASLALAELGEKAAQTAYVAENIAVSDDWAFYQAKLMRATALGAEADVLESLPAASDPAVHTRIAATRKEEARLRDDPKGGDGVKQLAEEAKRLEGVRNHAFHRMHQYETVVGALQIAILITSVSLLLRSRLLTVGASGLGAAAIVYGLLIWSEML